MAFEKHTSRRDPIDDRVFGMYSDRARAIEAIRELQAAGFTDRQIGVAMKDQQAQEALLNEAGSDAAHGAATGAVGGGVLGGLIGLLGSLIVPGLGPVVVGGVLASTLTGAGIGAVGGGVIGGLLGAGASEEDVAHLDTRFRAGDALVTVDAGLRRQEAIVILEEHDADMGPGLTRAARDADIAGSVSAGRSYEGAERRYRDDESYTGPERRLVGT